MIPPLHTVKHIVQQTTGEVTVGTIDNIDVIETVELSAVADANHVPSGSVIKAVYVEIWLNGEATSPAEPQFIFTVEKVQNGAAAMTFAQGNAMMAYTNKRNVLFISQGILGPEGNQSVPIHRGWIKIPKGKQRFALGDHLFVNISSVTHDIQRCGVFIYLEKS